MAIPQIDIINYTDPNTGEINPFYNRVEDTYGTVPLPEVDVTTPHTRLNLLARLARKGAQYFHNASDKAWNEFGEPVLLPIVTAPMDFYPFKGLFNNSRRLLRKLKRLQRNALNSTEVVTNIPNLGAITVEHLTNHPHPKISGDFKINPDQTILTDLNNRYNRYVELHGPVNDVDLLRLIEMWYPSDRILKFNAAERSFSNPVKTIIGYTPLIEHTKISIPEETKQIFRNRVFPRRNQHPLQKLEKVFDTPVFSITEDARNNQIILGGGDVNTPYIAWYRPQSIIGKEFGYLDDYIAVINTKDIPHELRHALEARIPLNEEEKTILRNAYSEMPNPFSYDYDMSKEWPTTNLETRERLFRNLNVPTDANLSSLKHFIDNATPDLIILALYDSNGYGRRWMEKLMELLEITQIPGGFKNKFGVSAISPSYLLLISPELIANIKKALNLVGMGTGAAYIMNNTNINSETTK